ncbi:hypothetical protein RUM44_006068 [Polyplax serrata]|uniref:Ig-like domain-containing protein n=1 Tax=Polyplax serrata TaxID=468196 RepID=A0ABR1B0R8_POLSC
MEYSWINCIAMHSKTSAFGAQRETGKNKESSSNALDFSNNRGAPFFDKAASKNVTALLGKTAYLNCRVKNLGNKTFRRNRRWQRQNVGDKDCRLIRLELLP